MRFTRYLAFLNKPYLLLLGYIFLSVVLMNFSDTASLRGVRWALLQVLNVVDSFKTEFTYRKNLEAENERLKKENFYLHITNQRMREMVLENARLRELLNLKTEHSYDFIAARVIAESSEKGINSRVLNVGEQGGVRENMAVVNAEGLVGKIIGVSAHQSIVQVLTDLNCRVGARLEKSREKGIVGWGGDPWLDLEYIPKNIRVEPGELVITSGLSEIYPEGLKIGVVTDFSETDYDMFMSVRVKPAVNFNALEEVFVIKTEIPENIARE